MNAVGEAVVKIGADHSKLQRVLRVIAKHANACADELQSLDENEERDA